MKILASVLVFINTKRVSRKLRQWKAHTWTEDCEPASGYHQMQLSFIWIQNHHEIGVVIPCRQWFQSVWCFNKIYWMFQKKKSSLRNLFTLHTFESVWCHLKWNRGSERLTLIYPRQHNQIRITRVGNWTHVYLTPKCIFFLLHCLPCS